MCPSAICAGTSDGTWQAPIVKFLSESERALIAERTQAKPGSLLFFQAMKRAGVPGELHVFAHGRHGVGLAPDLLIPAAAEGVFPVRCRTFAGQQDDADIGIERGDLKRVEQLIDCFRTKRVALLRSVDRDAHDAFIALAEGDV